MNKLTLTPSIQKKVKRLEKIDAPLQQLYYKGLNIGELLGKPWVAIVGTRKPSPYGRAQTEKLASELSRAGVVVVSGLALGVDAIAHEATLTAKGVCIAVLPSDVEHIYPATNRLLAERIEQSWGALVSEYESNPKPKKVDFLIRNRIVAALSDAVVVTEAAAQSGTLNTTRHAREMGIPIYAVPGNVTQPNSAGCNWLIQQGAKLLTDPAELLKDLGVDTKKQQSLDLSSSSPEETLIIQKIALGFGLTDELMSETGMDLGELQEVLTMLEIDSRISQTPQGNWELR